ncbi:unnamed protein product [Anisakis simplex]|uniref:Zinc finger protein 622 (inferred by orthology to a human protein) n=1 Tax=Anisakis simplex TaxID=6269 RepID=A0A0M3K1I4_ANISI|nr:unnamed protein product [Anisakis simplex]
MNANKLDASTGLTCISCRVVFANGEIQRDHYRSEWHRYNIKRRVADLPPITAHQFEQKVLSFKDKVTTILQKNAEKEELGTRSSFCELCNKQFQSTNAFENHLNSKRHKENQTKGSSISQQQRKSSNDKTEPQHTISNSSSSPSQQKSIVSQEVLDAESKIDREMNGSESEEDVDGSDSEGWVTDHGTEDEDDVEFDESKAIPTTCCLFCSHQSNTMERNLEHMGVSHGFFLPDAEYCIDIQGMLHYLGLKVGSGNICLLCNEKGKRFRSMDACQKHMRDKAHCRVAHEGMAMLEFEEFYDYSSMYPEGTEEGGEPNDILIEDGYSLILPSGARLGHRSLMRYYRQHLKPLNGQGETGNRKLTNREAINKLIGQYKAIGWTGTTGTLAVQRAKDIRFMRRLNAQKWLKVGMNSNKLFVSKGRSDQW